jgi:hypothetical protein
MVCNKDGIEDNERDTLKKENKRNHPLVPL